MIDIFGAENSVFSSDMRIWSWNQSLARRVSAAHAIDVLRDIFAEVCTNAQATLVEMDGEDDHVRLLIHYSFAVGAILPLKDAACRALWSRKSKK